MPQIADPAQGEFKAAVKQSFNVSAVPQIADPAQRTFVAGQERAARDAALAPGGDWGREELPPHRYCWPPV